VRQNAEGASQDSTGEQGKEVEVGWRPEHAVAVRGKATKEEESIED
jgi:hypothetical protein